MYNFQALSKCMMRLNSSSTVVLRGVSNRAVCSMPVETPYPLCSLRILVLAMGSTLLVVMLLLTNKASPILVRNTELGLHKQPPPPLVWERILFLERYYSGIRTLVSRDENVPEYLTEDDIELEMLASAD
jgi:hypothetical protein